MEVKGTEWHAEHRAFQDGYATGFFAAYTMIRKAVDLKNGLDYEMIKEKFEKYKQGRSEDEA